MLRKLLIVAMGIIMCSAQAYGISLSKDWELLNHILISRRDQSQLKMKLTVENVDSLVNYLNKIDVSSADHLFKLQKTLPKTTIELLRSAQLRGVSLHEADQMAAYLQKLVDKAHFTNAQAFDENTSHIIGRDWHEIDYSGENMTWEKQQLKYQPYGIENFKSLAMLKKFFPVESSLPYFNKIYQPEVNVDFARL